VSEVVRQQNKVMIGSGAGSVELTGARCSPNTVHWTYDTWAYGHSLARAIMQRGGKTWYFITADYAFGHDLERQAADQVNRDGGKVLGAVRAPIGTNDYSSFLISAQAPSVSSSATEIATRICMAHPPALLRTNVLSTARLHATMDTHDVHRLPL